MIVVCFGWFFYGDVMGGCDGGFFYIIDELGIELLIVVWGRVLLDWFWFLGFMFLVLDVVFVVEVEVWLCVEVGGIIVLGLKNMDWFFVLVLFLFLGINFCKFLLGFVIKAEISVWVCLVLFIVFL